MLWKSETVLSHEAKPFLLSSGFDAGRYEKAEQSAESFLLYASG